MRIVYCVSHNYARSNQIECSYRYRVIAMFAAIALFCCSALTVCASWEAPGDEMTEAGIFCGEADPAGEKKDEQLRLYAQSAVLMDADSGRVLYGKNAEDVLPMASTTKIMTCILALEYGNLEEKVEVSAYATVCRK